MLSPEPKETWLEQFGPVDGNFPEEIMKLKRQDGPELQVHGSSNLIQTLLKHDLADESV